MPLVALPSARVDGTMASAQASFGLMRSRAHSLIVSGTPYPPGIGGEIDSHHAQQPLAKLIKYIRRAGREVLNMRERNGAAGEN